MTRVRVEDLRTVRFCHAGARGWFARQGIEWQEFLQEGVSAERLRATGDEVVEVAIRAAEAREARGGADGR